MKTRKFNVHCWWNGYDQTHDVILYEGEKANIETFAREVQRLNGDENGCSTIIYSWSLIEE